MKKKKIDKYLQVIINILNVLKFDDIENKVVEENEVTEPEMIMRFFRKD